jgi:hypothetical protein
MKQQTPQQHPAGNSRGYCSSSSRCKLALPNPQRECTGTAFVLGVSEAQLGFGLARGFSKSDQPEAVLGSRLPQQQPAGNSQGYCSSSSRCKLALPNLQRKCTVAAFILQCFEAQLCIGTS